jgi:hypothetical protein
MNVEDFLTTLWSVLGGLLRLNPGAYQIALQSPDSLRLGLTVLLLGGLSITLGQSVVLFVNRVSRSRFALSLVASALLMVAGVALWALSIWVIASFVLNEQQPFSQVLTAVALSYAPFLFGFLVLLPYLGNILDHILHIWVFLGTLVGIAVLFGFSLWQALLCCLLGWVLVEVISRFATRAIEAAEDWVWRVSTGTPAEQETEALIEAFVRQAREESGEWRVESGE